MRGEWIEIAETERKSERTRSLPMRGEWIEIIFVAAGGTESVVSPHAGRVD